MFQSQRNTSDNNFIRRIKEETPLEIVTYLDENESDEMEVKSDLHSCSTCGMNFEFRCDLVLHGVSHTKPEAENCVMIEISDTEDCDLIEDNKKRSQKFICRFCKKTTTSHLSLTAHIAKNHTIAKLLKCDFNGCVFETRVSFHKFY